jgi:hypothetical protein
VEDAETGMGQEQEDMRSVESEGLTSRDAGQMLKQMLNAIRGSLSDLVSSDDEEDGEGEENVELRMLSKDDEPGWVMGRISKTVEQRMEGYRQKQMKLDELTQLEWGDAADYFCEEDKKYVTTELKVLAVNKPHRDDDVATPAPTMFRELMEPCDIIPEMTQIPQGASRPQSSHMKLGPCRRQLNKHILSPPPDAQPYLLQIMKVKPIEPVSLRLCIVPSS